MNLFSLFLIAVGLSMDAFAVSVCAGLTMSKPYIKKSVIIGLYFCVFQAAMPLIGYIAASRFADAIIAYDHWIAFILLCFIGLKMIIESFKFKKEKQSGEEFSLKPARMLYLSVATSIDALAVGVSFAFLQINNIVPAVFFIGIITFLFSVAGVKIGNIFGAKFKPAAEFAGGIILILIGLKILLEHTGVI
ncbi:MAG: manganese efflux pump MntP family protein [Oscillospiraceae bacterium]|nr:manganese efflux pump MntP family protein [Oscillospiraceae bacterium]